MPRALLLLLLCGLFVMPSAVDAREDLSAGESGDPGDGTGFTSTCGPSPDWGQAVTAIRPTGTGPVPHPVPQILLIPVPLPNGVSFHLVVVLPVPRGGQ